MPRVIVSVIPLEVYTYENVTFNVTACDPDGKILLYEWDFDNDGIFDWYSTFGGNTTWSYPKCGKYNATVKVTDNNLTVTVFTVNIVVKNRAPNADFTYIPMSPTDLELVYFTDNSTDNDGSVISWYWEFGDGNTSTMQNPTHQYLDNGTYYVNLTVTDDDGESSITCQKSITILNAAPTANFTYTPTSPTDLELVYFTDNSTDNDGSV
ncbi:MAG: PKD domain-containing protein, partial [Thermoplasmatales archaeon]|nr:PKD domain-containing protein [Thermoplasmatales archaeon]